jgi:hypothetical protein
MAKRIAAARDRILALYRDRLEIAQRPASSQSSSAPRANTDQRRQWSAREKIARRLAPQTSLVSIGARRGVLVATVDNVAVLYRDVPTAAWYAPYVATVIAEDIAQGYRDEAGNLTGEFGVGNSVTVAEVLKMGLEAAGTSVAGAAPPRNDSARGTWAEAYVAAAETQGLVPPTQDVHAPATRGEVFEFILRLLGYPIARQPAQFRDVPAEHPHNSAIATAAFYGLVEGDTAVDGTPLGTVRPDDFINRAEVAKLIALARELLK